MAAGLALAVRAGPPVVQLTDQQQRYPLGLHLELLEDPGKQLSISDVTSAAFADAFVPSRSVVPLFGYTTSAHWVRFTVQNSSQKSTDWLLEIADPNLDSLTLYLLPAQSHTPILSGQTGDLLPRSTRHVDYHNFVFRLTLEPDQPYTAYLRVENRGATPLPLVLWSPAAFGQYQARSLFGLGFFYGVIAIMICFNLLLLLFFRESMYVFYVITVANLGFYFASADGLAAQFLWPNQLWWGDVAILVFIGLTLVSGIHFGVRFLRTSTYAPLLDRILTGLSGVTAGVVLLALIPKFYRPAAQTLAVLTVATVLVGMAAAIKAYLNGYLPARYFLLAWAGIFLGAVLLVLRQFGLIPASIYTEYTVRVGAVLLVLLLSLALADRINLLRAATEAANARLHASENRLRQFLDAMPMGLFVLNKDLYVSYVSRRAAEIFDLDRRDFPVRPHFDQVLPNLPLVSKDTEQPYPQDQLPILQALQGKRINTTDIEVLRNDRRTPLEVWAEPIFDEHGEITYAIAAFQDISARQQVEDELNRYRQSLEELVARRTDQLAQLNEKLYQEIDLLQQAEQKIQRQNEFLNTVLESLSDPFYVINVKDYTIEIANSAARAQATAGVTTCYALMYGKNVPCDDGAHPCPLAIVAKSKKPFVTEHVRLDKNGNRQQLEMHGFPIFDKNGNVVQMIEYSLDITRRKQTEAALHQRNRQLALINRASQIFSSTLELDEVIQFILGEMHRLFDIVATSYWLYQPETGELVCKQASGPNNERVVGWRLASGQGITGRAVKTGQPIIVPDTMAEPDYFADVDEYTGLALRSMITFPLRAKGEIIGVLNLADTTTNRFNQEDVTLIEPIATAAASAIKNAQLFDETQRQRKVAESLRQVSTILNTSLDLDTVLGKILEQLRRVIQFDGAGLFLLDDQDLRLTSGTAQVQHLLGHKIPVDSSNITTEPLKQKQAVIEADIQTTARWRADWPKTEPYGLEVHGWMGAPLRQDENPIGVLTVDSFKVGAYTEKDAQILQTFANQAAIAIENASLLEKEQQQRQMAESLREVALVLNSSLDQSVVVAKILEELRNVLPYDSAGLFLAEGDDLILSGGANLDQKYIGYRIAINGKVRAAEVFRSRQPIITPDVRQDPYWQNEPTSGLILSWMATPLVSSNEAIGVLTADSFKVNTYSDADARVLQTFANQAAIAIQNARLFQQAQQQRQMVEQALAELKATQNQLVVQEKMASLGMLTAGIAHEIKNPLNFVTSFAQLSIELAQDLGEILRESPLNDRRRAEVDEILGHLQFNARSISDEGYRANSIVQSMLQHSRGGSSHERQETDLNVLLKEAVNLAFHSLRAQDINFYVQIETHYDEMLAPLQVVPQNLSRVFVNLVNNAYYATREKSVQGKDSFEAKIRVSTKNLEKSVEIRVWDNGLGVSPEKIDKLFTPFFTTKPSGQGTGLGLSISYDIIVQEHGGTISVQSKVGHYTEFIINLPK